jgi:hypothetical protein
MGFIAIVLYAAFVIWICKIWNDKCVERDRLRGQKTPEETTKRLKEIANSMKGGVNMKVKKPKPC